jgi:hypothetical protein
MTTSGVFDCGYCRSSFQTEQRAVDHRENAHAQYAPPPIPLCTECWNEPRVPRLIVCAGCREKHKAETYRKQIAQWDAIERDQYRMYKWSLDSFPAADAAGKAALKAVEPWLWAVANQRIVDGKLVPIDEDDPNIPDDDPIWPWFHGDHWNLSLFIYGGVGSGKSGLAWSLLRARVLGKYDYEDSRDEWPAWANIIDLLDKCKAAMKDGDGGELIRKLYNSSILVLDDLGAERPTAWALDAIAALVQHRHAANLPTIVTSNYAPSALVQRLGHSDQMIGRRIVSRLTEDCIKVKLDRADIRPAKKAA